MSNVVQVLKAEIGRIAKRETKALGARARKQAAQMRQAVAALKRSLDALQKQNALLVKAIPPPAVDAPATEPAAGTRSWISSSGIRSLRKRLGLSQEKFGKLVGVSAQSVIRWESRGGKLTLRKAVMQTVTTVRGIGAKEARECLETMAAKPKKTTAVKPAGTTAVAKGRPAKRGKK